MYLFVGGFHASHQQFKNLACCVCTNSICIQCVIHHIKADNITLCECRSQVSLGILQCLQYRWQFVNYTSHFVPYNPYSLLLYSILIWIIMHLSSEHTYNVSFIYTWDVSWKCHIMVQFQGKNDIKGNITENAKISLYTEKPHSWVILTDFLFQNWMW